MHPFKKCFKSNPEVYYIRFRGTVYIPESMANSWNSGSGVLTSSPSLKHLTQTGFGLPKPHQHQAVQDLVKAHVESFDQAVTDGLCRVVQVCSDHVED